MIRISSKVELLNCFRQIDRDQVQLPSDMSFPLAIKNFASWIEPSGHRAYVVFESPDGSPTGVSFARMLGNSDAAPAMCQWCNRVAGGSDVSLMTATASPSRYVGIHLCSDIKCGQEEARLPGVHDMRESIDKSQRILRILSRMNDFAKINLF